MEGHEEGRLQAIVRLRVIVGYLGEKAQFDWWQSGFFTPSSAAFLNPVFARTSALAQYHGVKEAARRLHDEHIGVGRMFHLFRLPETLEQSLFEFLKEPAVVAAVPPRHHLADLRARRAPVLLQDSDRWPGRTDPDRHCRGPR